MAAPTTTVAEAETGTIEVSVVIPCMNEEITVGEFIDWCHEGFARAGVTGEIIIADSSTDNSPAIAEAHGARVISVPRLGVGAAYIAAIPHVRGEIVIMGDCDLTYDFRDIAPFVEAIHAGYEFVQGSRLNGDMEPDAMPKLHRYFGGPGTTWTFNRIYGTHYKDIHCGMRAMTREALERMQLQAPGWEYASELVLKAHRLRMRTTEVQIPFYKDREGRQSHLAKRGGWKVPWGAGWNSIKLQSLYAPDYFLLWPGVLATLLGLVISVALADGPFVAFGVGFNLHWMLLGLVLATVGYSAVQLALLARVFHDFDPRFTDRVLERLTYNRCVAASTVLVAAGLVPNVVLLVRWINHGLHHVQYYSIFGLLLMILGFQTFAFTLLLHMIGEPVRRNRTS